MLDSVISTSMTLSAFLICEIAAVVLGLLTALIFTVRGHHTSSFAVTLATLPPMVTLVIMLVNGNIGAGLAVAGTFAMVRFRSVPGTAKEIAALFMSVAIGLTCGMGYVTIAAIFFVIMAIFVLLLTFLRFGEGSESYRRLKIIIPENLDYEDLFEDIFEKYTRDHSLVRVKTTNMGTLYELSYDIHLKSTGISKQFIDEIRCRNGNLNIICGREADKDMM